MPDSLPLSEELKKLLEIALERGGPCIVFPGRINTKGYGYISLNGRCMGAHVVEWEKINGPVPKGLELDHLCRNRACVNPGHLEAVTPRINILRGVSPSAINARKTECHKGHVLSGDNVLLRRGRRYCKKCQRASDLAYKKRNIERLRKYSRDYWREKHGLTELSKRLERTRQVGT